MGKSNTGGKFLIMDGHSLAYRAFFALPLELQTKKGLHKMQPSALRGCCCGCWKMNHQIIFGHI